MTTLEFHRVLFCFFHGVYVCACRTSSDCAPLSLSPLAQALLYIIISALSFSHRIAYQVAKALSFSVIVGVSWLQRTGGLLFVSN
jgi:hypothetical protein